MPGQQEEYHVVWTTCWDHDHDAPGGATYVLHCRPLTLAEALALASQGEKLWQEWDHVPEGKPHITDGSGRLVHIGATGRPTLAVTAAN